MQVKRCGPCSIKWRCSLEQRFAKHSTTRRMVARDQVVAQALGVSSATFLYALKMLAGGRGLKGGLAIAG